MKPQDIIVGKQYKHDKWPNTVYLGCGTLNHDSSYSNKSLVIIKDKKYKQLVGCVLKYENSDAGSWDGFSLI